MTWGLDDESLGLISGGVEQPTCLWRHHLGPLGPWGPRDPKGDEVLGICLHNGGAWMIEHKRSNTESGGKEWEWAGKYVERCRSRGIGKFGGGGK